jgi:endogenous inhibitor of DNA gyrase (YacG/DUF329 family)
MLTKNCPTCGQKAELGADAHFPFCSSRCRDRDFLGWTDGNRTLSTPITDADEALELFDLD